MAGFLQGLGQAYGRNLIFGQDMAEKQSLIDERNTQTAQARAQMAALARQQKTQEDVGQFVSSEMQKDANTINDPAATSKMYEKAAGIALRDGDFKSADTMNQLAKSKLQEAKEAAAYQVQQQQLKKEDLANAADALTTNPTQEGLQELVKKAAAAGINPTTIPKPGTPEFSTWVNQQKMASMNAKEKAEFTEKAKEANDRQQETIRNHNMEDQRAREQRAQTAMMRESMIGIARFNAQTRADEAAARGPAVKDIGGSQYQYDPSGKIQGDRDTPDQNWVKVGEKMTSQQKTGVSRGSYAAAEVTRSLTKVLQFDPGTTTGPFASLGAHTPLEALTKIGSNAITPAQFQSMNVNAAGLGNQIASLEAALGGRMAAGTQQQHLQDMAVPQPGDSGYTAAYKVANAKELTVTALKHLPGNFAKTEAGKAQIKELEDSIPFSTDDVIKAMKKDPSSSKSQDEIRNLMKDVGKVKENITEAAQGVGGDESPVPSAAPAGASVPGLPAGWTVKEK